MNIIATISRQPWNKEKLVGQKSPLRLRDIWAIRVRLQIAEITRDLALLFKQVKILCEKVPRVRIV